MQAANAQPVPQDAEVEVLLEEMLIRFEADGRRTRRVWRIYRCLTEQSLENWSYCQAEWAPWHEQRPQIRARVISPQGEVHLLAPENLAAVRKSRRIERRPASRSELRATAGDLLQAIRRYGISARLLEAAVDASPQRIAQQYELPDVAASMYRKVNPPEVPLADDTYVLAQRQLEALANTTTVPPLQTASGGPHGNGPLSLVP